MIIYRYFSRQLFTATLSITFILVLILISGRFIKYMSEAAEGRIGSDALFTIMLYRLPSFLEMILPLGLFLGILMAYGRLYLENEMTVLNAAGLGQKGLLMHTSIPTLAMTLTVAALSIFIAPWSAEYANKLIYEQKNRTEFETLTPGRFHISQDKTRMTYTEQLSADKKYMERLYIIQQLPNKVSVITAHEGRRRLHPDTGVQYLDLQQGYRYEGMPGQADFTIVEFMRYQLKLSEPDHDKKVAAARVMPTATLLNNPSPIAHAELQWRLSLPLLVPIVAALALPLSRVNPRQGRYLKMLPSILLYLAYLTLLSSIKNAIEKEQIPSWIGVWWVHISFLILAIGLNGWPTWQYHQAKKNTLQRDAKR